MLAASMFGGDSFDEYDPGLFGCGGVVTNAAGNDEELTRANQNIAAIGFGSTDAQLTANGPYLLGKEFSGADLLLKTGKIDAVICLGCVIQGETRHFDFICNAVANGISNVAIKYARPVVFGVLTTDNEQQAIDRAGGKHGNKGDEAAITAIKMADLAETLNR